MIDVMKCGVGLLVAALLTSACTPSIPSRVTRFHELAPPSGEAVAVVAEEPEETKPREFAHYARMIEEELNRVGYTVVESAETADLVAEVDYDVGDPQQDMQIDRFDGPYAGYWFRRGYFYPYSYGWYPGFYTYPGVGSSRLSAQRRVPRALEIDIIDPDAGDVATVFEGRVYSLGREQDLNEVMPYLVAAMFTNFPGDNGVTKVVTIEGDGLPKPSNGNGYGS